MPSRFTSSRSLASMRRAASSPQSRITIADPAQRQVQRVHVAGQALGLGDVDDLLLEQLGKVLVEALAARFAVADGPFELLELALKDVLSHQRRGHHDFNDRD